jgi:hypothetical protein
VRAGVLLAGAFALMASAAAGDPHPDLSGVWVISKRSSAPYTDDAGQPLKTLPLTPWGASQRAKAAPALDPSTRCLNMFPRIMSWPYPIQVVETEKSTVILFEADTTFRQIYTDGRVLNPDDDPAWMGRSVGRWDGDTLIVDTRGVKSDAWLDADGTPLSEDLHVTERVRLFDNGKSLEDQMTIEDPKVFTTPVHRRLVYNLKPDWSLMEYVCEEGNRDDAAHPKPGAPGSLTLPGAGGSKP